MAKLPQGILGPISGTIGNIVGANWRDVNYIRSKAKKSDKPRTAEQLENQEKFKFLQDFLQPFRSYFIVGFQNVSRRRSEWNSGFTENYGAVLGSSPQFYIDYTKINLSTGPQPNLHDLDLRYVTKEVLELTWKFAIVPMSKASDQVVFVVYDRETRKAYGNIGGTGRSTEWLRYHLHPTFVGKQLDVFVYVTSLSRKLVSPTKYLGRVSFSSMAT